MPEILGEIVGGYKLCCRTKAGETVVEDDDGMKPYCIVRLGKKVIHQTKKAEGGRNPVWTVSTGAFFLMDVDEDQLMEEVLSVSVWYKEKDPLQLTVMKTWCFGQVKKRLLEIFLDHCDESRLDLDLWDPKSRKSQPSASQGSITLRFRLATSYDKRFLSTLAFEPKLLKQKSTSTTENVSDAQSSLLVTEANETEVAGASFMNVLSSALTSKTYIDQSTGQSMRLVKPHPDPDNVQKTTYIAENTISSTTLEPSQKWIEAGSGDLGRVYLEILSCHDLPNLDVGGEAMGNVTGKHSTVARQLFPPSLHHPIKMHLSALCLRMQWYKLL